MEVAFPKVREHIQTCKKGQYPSDGDYADDEFVP
ncbi:hypothetical protein GBAR_LOCUS3953 [Geodia barretti]|uniref:Uncharacterized protein n=1 Tax=Geodia barretti TaxID=519541 RepID=A0AA35W7P0_GEOBA|nr:hypothetical protein GBAR_LOCUS3953 [Geodia barretti]